jgi:hypothetical protein
LSSALSGPAIPGDLPDMELADRNAPLGPEQRAVGRSARQKLQDVFLFDDSPDRGHGRPQMPHHRLGALPERVRQAFGLGQRRPDSRAERRLGRSLEQLRLRPLALRDLAIHREVQRQEEAELEENSGGEDEQGIPPPEKQERDQDGGAQRKEPGGLLPEQREPPRVPGSPGLFRPNAHDARLSDYWPPLPRCLERTVRNSLNSRGFER